jgi:hypothetical protein
MKLKSLAIITITISIFLNLFFYIPYARIISVPGYILYSLVFIFVFFYYFIYKIKININKELFLWFILYFFINSFYILLNGFGEEEFKYYIPVIMSIPIFLSLSLLFNLDNTNLNLTRKSITIGIIVGVILLITDFIKPGYFISNSDTLERAVATYGNSNIAGAVIILGMILTIDIIQKKFKFFYIVFLFLGILVTFSRSNIIIFFIILLFMTYQNKISKHLLIFLVSSIFLFLIILIFGGFQFLHDTFDMNISNNLINRINFFVDNNNADLSNISERKTVLLAALEIFMNNPIFGAGFASTRIWEYPVGPHNTIMMTFAEFGIFAILIVPLFLFINLYKAHHFKIKEYYDMTILFTIYYLLSCMFSHNMLEQSFNIAGIIIISTLLNKKSQKD